MIKTRLLCGVVLTVIPLLAPGKDFPLEFKTLTAEEAMSLRSGGSGAGSLQLDKPGNIAKAPKAISKHPLYGQLSGQTKGLWFQIDESMGDGKGYDRLILDLNRNGDLTDDPVTPRVDKPAPDINPNFERSVFGPIAAPEENKIGSWQPIYYARMNVYNLPAAIKSGSRSTHVGQLSLRPGWYLETTVETDGVTRKAGIIDGNCSFRLGEADKPFTYTNRNEVIWYFGGGDSYLVDNDGSGKFKSTIDNHESVPFGPLLYLGAKPYKAVLAGESKSLTLEPWSGPLAELVMQPHGEQVCRMEVAWESAPDQWQLLKPGVENGKANVPPGNYRLIGCTLKVNTAVAGETLILEGYKRAPEGTVKAEPGAATPFKCGSPLEIKVTSERDTRNMVSDDPESGSWLTRLFRGNTRDEKAVRQLIEASVTGSGGETFSGFYLQAKGNLRQPPSPAFTVTATDGKVVASGNLEFG